MGFLSGIRHKHRFNGAAGQWVIMGGKLRRNFMEVDPRGITWSLETSMVMDGAARGSKTGTALYLTATMPDGRLHTDQIQAAQERAAREFVGNATALAASLIEQ